MVLQNQGMLGIAFFEATAVIILLVLFLLFRRDQQAGYFRYWLSGWCCLTFSSLCEVAVLIRDRQSGQAVFEARASNNSNSASFNSVMPAMFAAALKDFPAGGVHPRRVTVDIAKP